MWSIFPIFVEIASRIHAKVCPFSFDGVSPSFFFDEEVLGIADGEGWFLTAADDVSQLGISAAIGEWVGEIDDDEL